ncbi:hypothetical protein [Gemmobacter serpentinus]|uniref:hypothetical protein n=1 Tax=Gemmobacter serpentinus TaxID=2652247 RepID=UPI00124CC675|nr:hypothetical protein [Gemmobacter serpentinus]
MRKFTLVAAALAMTALAACKDETATCTPEQAQAKLTEFMTLAQTAAASNPQKLTELTPKLTEVQQQLTANPNDTVAACKALDDMIAALK